MPGHEFHRGNCRQLGKECRDYCGQRRQFFAVAKIFMLLTLYQYYST